MKTSRPRTFSISSTVTSPSLKRPTWARPSGSLLQRRLGLPDAAVTVLLGFAFVALIGCETLRGRSFWKRKA